MFRTFYTPEYLTRVTKEQTVDDVSLCSVTYTRLPEVSQNDHNGLRHIVHCRVLYERWKNLTACSLHGMIWVRRSSSYRDENQCNDADLKSLLSPLHPCVKCRWIFKGIEV